MSLRRRLRVLGRLREQRGYSLGELLVVAAVVGMIASAAFWVYDVAARTYRTAASLEDAQLGSRAVVDRLAREFRLIGSFVAGTDAPAAISSASSTSITFLSDIDSDTVASNVETTTNGAASGTSVVVTGTPSGFSANEYLYIASGATREMKLVSSVSGSTLTLSTTLANTYASGSLTRSVETVTWSYNSSAKTLSRTVGSSSAETIFESVSSFSLTYYDSSGTVTNTASSIREIEINVGTQASDGTIRTMKARVRPVSLSLS